MGLSVQGRSGRQTGSKIFESVIKGFFMENGEANAQNPVKPGTEVNYV
jgi:hypothetical protein